MDGYDIVIDEFEKHYKSYSCEYMAFILLKYSFEKDYRRTAEYFRYIPEKDMVIFENDWCEGEEDIKVVVIKSLDDICDLFLK